MEGFATLGDMLRDTRRKDFVCPYNNFAECFYERCPFYRTLQRKHRCLRADADSVIPNTNVSINNNPSVF